MVLEKIHKHRLIVFWAALVIGLFLRYFKLEETVFFDADQENFAWTAVRLLEEKRPVLIGLKAGEFPVFIGPLMYYVYALFFQLFSMDPAGLSYLSMIFAFLSIVSIFFISSRVFGNKAGLLSVFLYSFSFFFIDNDRRVWLPGPMIILSLWLFYFLWRVNNREQKKWLIILGMIFFLGFQLHITALFFFLIAIIGVLVKRIKVGWSSAVLGLGTAFLGIIPVIIFDLRHGFINFKGWQTLFVRAGEKVNYFSRFLNLVRYNLENEVRIFSLPINLTTKTVAGLIFLYWVVQSLRKGKNQKSLRLAWLWIIVPFLVFLPVNLHIPEYYLILTFPILLIVTSTLIINLSQRLKLVRLIAPIALLTFLVVNLRMTLGQEIDKAIFLHYKKQAVDYVIKEAESKDFSVFYEMDRGYNYGYDYLFYWKLGKIPEKSQEPDFIIVVPWNYKGLSLTERFGGVGVIKK